MTHTYIHTKSESSGQRINWILCVLFDCHLKCRFGTRSFKRYDVHGFDCAPPSQNSIGPFFSTSKQFSRTQTHTHTYTLAYTNVRCKYCCFTVRCFLHFWHCHRKRRDRIDSSLVRIFCFFFLSESSLCISMALCSFICFGKWLQALGEKMNQHKCRTLEYSRR